MIRLMEFLYLQYLENNCVDDPVKLCDFQLLENRIMKTVDSVYQVRRVDRRTELCITLS